MKVYIAGRIKYERDGFGLDVDISRDQETYWNSKHKEFVFGSYPLIYTGPFTVGCDHGCAHVYDHSVGPTCREDPMPVGHSTVASGHSLKQEMRVLVVNKTTDGIKDAHVVFAWLGADSQLAHGTLVEIGYAVALNKPVYIGHDIKDSDETWYAKTLATKCYATRDFDSFFAQALRDHYISISKP